MKAEHETHLLRLIQGFGDSQFTIGQCNMINGHAPAFDEVRQIARAKAEHTIDKIYEILREDRKTIVPLDAEEPPDWVYPEGHPDEDCDREGPPPFKHWGGLPGW